MTRLFVTELASKRRSCPSCDHKWSLGDNTARMYSVKYYRRAKARAVLLNHKAKMGCLACVANMAAHLLLVKEYNFKLDSRCPHLVEGAIKVLL